MAHKLATKADGTAAFVESYATVKEKAWHGLGIGVDTALTSEQAIKLAGLDYEVAKVPVIEVVGNEQFTSEDLFTIQRTDRTGKDAILGRVGSKYTALQNTEAFDFMDTILGKGEAGIETAGALGNGEKVFITCTVPAQYDIQIAKNDWVRTYLFVYNSHDGKGMVTAAMTPVRIVCNNTLQMAFKKCDNKVAFRHTSGVADKLKNGMKVLGLRDMFADEMRELLPAMAKTKISDKEFANVIASAFITDNKQYAETFKNWKDGESSKQLQNTVNDVLEYHWSNETQKMNSTKGTIWGAYNAVTGYFQNVMQFDSQSDKTDGIMIGTEANKSKLAFDYALTLMS